MSSEKPFILALDLGGTNFRVALASREGHILRRATAPTNAIDGRERVMRRINQCLREVASAEIDGVGAISLGVAGPIDQNGVILSPPNLPGWDNTPLRSLWEEEFRVPVYIGNDCNLAALGEYRFGAGRGRDNIVYIAIGTGIGGGVIIDGRLFTGSGGLATELGHMTIDPSGPRCNCGNTGCLEALASGTAIARAAVERIQCGEASTITRLVNSDLGRVTAETVQTAAISGDKLARDVIERAGRDLGIGITNLLHLFNPELVIIGGGVAMMGELILNPARKTVAERAMPSFIVPIVPSSLGDDAGLLGAVALVGESSGLA